MAAAEEGDSRRVMQALQRGDISVNAKNSDDVSTWLTGGNKLSVGHLGVFPSYPISLSTLNPRVSGIYGVALCGIEGTRKRCGAISSCRDRSECYEPCKIYDILAS
jgi:hypothetical protein